MDANKNEKFFDELTARGQRKWIYDVIYSATTEEGHFATVSFDAKDNIPLSAETSPINYRTVNFGTNDNLTNLPKGNTFKIEPEVGADFIVINNLKVITYNDGVRWGGRELEIEIKVNGEIETLRVGGWNGILEVADFSDVAVKIEKVTGNENSLFHAYLDIEGIVQRRGVILREDREDYITISSFDSDGNPADLGIPFLTVTAEGYRIV